MRLKNKKTGEIGNLQPYGGDGRIWVWVDNRSRPEYRYNSLAELNAEWCDAPEEPKGYWFIDVGTYEVDWCEENEDLEADKEIGNYFETKEQAELAVCKLKAWKRLKDNGFRFEGWEDLQAEMGIDDLMLFNRDVLNTDNIIGFRMDDYHDCIKDLNTCFRGEE